MVGAFHAKNQVGGIATPLQTQSQTLKRHVVTKPTTMSEIGSHSTATSSDTVVRSVTAKQLAKHKQVYKWATERVLNHMDM